MNVGVGTLATAKRPAEIAIKPLMAHYADAAARGLRARRGAADATSALLPMGGAVSGVAGANWALIGDAAACVNPLNGEGIDYGLESGRLVVETMTEHATCRASGRRCCASTTARRSRSPAAWPVW